MNYKKQILKSLNRDSKKYLELIQEISNNDENQIQFNNDLKCLEKNEFIKSILPESNVGNPKYTMTDSGNEYYNHYFKYIWNKHQVTILTAVILPIIILIISIIFAA